MKKIVLMLIVVSLASSMAESKKNCKSLLGDLWKDEKGVVVTTELVLASTLLVSGVAIGLTELRDAVNQELFDTAQSVRSINQSISITGIGSANGSGVAGTRFEDQNVNYPTMQSNR